MHISFDPNDTSPFDFDQFDLKRDIQFIFDIVHHLPKCLQISIHNAFHEFFDIMRAHIKRFIIEYLDLEKKHTLEQFQAIVRCITLREYDASEFFTDQWRDHELEDDDNILYPRPFHDVLSLVCAMCQTRNSDEERTLNNLKRLREMDYIRKEDIRQYKLLSHSLKLQTVYDPDWGYKLINRSYHRLEMTEYDYYSRHFDPNVSIFHYLMEWDPDALTVEMDEFDSNNPLLEVIRFHREDVTNDMNFIASQCLLEPEYHQWSIHYSIDMLRMLLKAGLKYLPYQLGLLLQSRKLDYLDGQELRREEEEDMLTDENVHDISEDPDDYFSNDMTSAYAMACGSGKKTFGPDKVSGWSLIKECLEEADDRILEQDPKTNLYPFMLAAADRTCRRLDLLYYLLRRDPSVCCRNDIIKEAE